MVAHKAHLCSNNDKFLEQNCKYTLHSNLGIELLRSDRNWFEQILGFKKVHQYEL